MKKDRHLYIVSNSPKPLLQGPITRMDLWYRFEPTPKKQWILVIISKLALIATLFYVVYGK